MTYSSRLLQTLDQQIQQCTNHDDLARLVSRRAIHLARLNHLDEAKAEIARLRTELGTALGAGAGAWILLAEGIIGYFDLDVERAFDRLRRSNGIAQAAKLTNLLGSTYAWLSHVEYQRADYKRAIQHLNIALDVGAKDDHFCRCRTALVASDICGFASIPEEARVWQQIARFHASAEGDETSLAALLFNATIYRIGEIRLADAFDKEKPESFGATTKELDSSLTYDEFSSGFGLPNSPSILNGHIQVVRKEFSTAVEIFQFALKEGIFDFNRAAVEADLSYSFVSIGDFESAKSHAEAAIKYIGVAADIDELAFVHARLMKYFSLINDHDSKIAHWGLALEALKKLEELQEELQILLQTLPNPNTVLKALYQN